LSPFRAVIVGPEVPSRDVGSGDARVVPGPAEQHPEADAASSSSSFLQVASKA